MYEILLNIFLNFEFNLSLISFECHATSCNIPLTRQSKARCISNTLQASNLLQLRHPRSSASPYLLPLPPKPPNLLDLAPPRHLPKNPRFNSLRLRQPQSLILLPHLPLHLSRATKTQLSKQKATPLLLQPPSPLLRNPRL